MGNPSGQHFILSESYSSQTQDALDRISVGSTWSMKGRVAGKGKVPVTQSLPTKQYLQLTKDLTSGSANWSLSEYLGYNEEAIEYASKLALINGLPAKIALQTAGVLMRENQTEAAKIIFNQLPYSFNKEKLKRYHWKNIKGN